MLAGVEVKIGGRALDPALAERLHEVRVDDNLMLPDTFVLRLGDPGMEHVDSSPLEIGADVEIHFAGPGEARSIKLFEGQIASLEPEFADRGIVLAARGYDRSHALNRTKLSQTYQNVTLGDVARTVASRAGLTPGDIDNGGGTHDFVQQSNETDWAFLWRLASRIDCEVVVVDKKLHFRKAGGDSGTPVALRWGESLTSFRPRMTGVQQVDEVVVRGWNPATKSVIEATAKADTLSSKIGVARSSIVGAIGGGSVTVADRPVTTPEEAQALAKSVAAQLGNAYVEADGVARGDPRLRAGAKIQVEGIGQRFGGTYALSSSVHTYRSGRGYETRFTISGRSPRSLVEVMSPAQTQRFGDALAIGVVTQNDDPESLGRVRVRYPALSDDVEGWWARVASPSAGKDRGLLMLPVVGEEVVVGFEHGDSRKPMVLGSLWNGTDTPGDLAKTDGSFALQSDKDIAVKAKGPITIKGDGDITLDAGGKLSGKSTQDLSLNSDAKITVKAGASLTIEGQGEVTVKGSQLTLQATGVVRVTGSQVMLG